MINPATQRRRGWLRWLTPLCLLALSSVTIAQTPVPPSPTAAPTEPPAVIVIQATPVPEPTPAGNIFRAVLESHQSEIVLALILAVVTGILVGVVGQWLIRTLLGWLNKGLDWLMRTFTDWTFSRRRLYREYVAALDQETYEWQSLHGKELDLDRFYIQVQVTHAPASLTPGEGPTEGWLERWTTRRRERKMEPRQALSQYQRLVVVGDPGAGKTTLLRYLAYLYAHGKVGENSQEERNGQLPRFARRRKGAKLPQTETGLREGRPRRHRTPGWLPGHRVPVFIPLKSLAVGGVSDLAEYLPTHFAQHNYPGADRFIQEKLKRGEFIFLLDALDEVDDPAQLPAVVDLVVRFARQCSNEQRPNWIVVASRPHSFQACAQALNFQAVEVLEFEPQQMRDFILNWFRDQPRPERGERLWEIISQDRQLLELSSNPLLLTYITEVFDQRNELDSRRRVDLFARIVDVRFWEWDRRRSVWRDFEFTQPVKENFLRATALHLNTSAQPFIRRDALLQRVRQFMLADGRVDPDDPDPSHNRTQAERFLWEIAEGSGILHQKAIAAYDFSHQALREYFCALRLCELPDGLERLCDRLQGPGFDSWRMVALLYAGKAHDAAALVRGIWGMDPTLSQRGLLLAARCLRDAASTSSDPCLRADLADALFTALPEATPEDAEEGAGLLRSIAADRLETYIERLLGGPPSTAALQLAAQLAPEQVSEGLRRAAEPVLEEALRSPDEALRTRAALLLSQVGAGEAAAPLLRSLEGPEAEARAAAALGLARLGRPAPEVLAALRHRMLADPAPEARHAARDALLLLGCADELDMVRIPAGEFLMGTSDEQRAYLKERYGWDYDWIGDEMPQRSVDLAEYFIDRTPVTNARFAAFVEDTGYVTTAENAGRGYVRTAGKWDEMRGAAWAHPRGPGSRWEEIPDHPVVLVSWDDAVAYSEWAGKQLPSEAQWEKAARGTDGRLWPWGDTWEEGRGNTASYHAGRPLLDEQEWRRWWEGFDVVKYGAPTTPVGAFPQGASPYGLLDCAGNVWEWTRDWYRPYPGSPYESDRYGETYRVLRGGAWASHPFYTRAASRDYGPPESRYINYGFRCVVVAPVILS